VRRKAPSREKALACSGRHDLPRREGTSLLRRDVTPFLTPSQRHHTRRNHRIRTRGSRPPSSQPRARNGQVAEGEGRGHRAAFRWYDLRSRAALVRGTWHRKERNQVQKAHQWRVNVSVCATPEPNCRVDRVRLLLESRRHYNISRCVCVMTTTPHRLNCGSSIPCWMMHSRQNMGSFG
jgi:hypothetical protein